MPPHQECDGSRSHKQQIITCLVYLRDRLSIINGEAVEAYDTRTEGNGDKGMGRSDDT